MTPVDAIETMLDLFQGRPDAWGGDEGRAIYGTVDEKLMEGHLYGVQGIGIYPVRFTEGMKDNFTEMSSGEHMENMVVKWGCCDIDTGDWEEAYKLAMTLRKMGLTPWVERSRSKGWHVWIFSDTWVPAYIMRRCLKIAYAAIDLQAKEANPKSELLRPNQLGNYVRLPYKGALPDDVCERQTMMYDWSVLNDGYCLSFGSFLFMAEDGDVVSSETTIRKWAAKWYEAPAPNVTVKDVAVGPELEALIQSLPYPLRTLWTNGPKARTNGETDTSQGLVALAHNLAQAGWAPDDVYSVVVSGDLRWGKFHTRNDPDNYYRDIVNRAYA